MLGHGMPLQQCYHKTHLHAILLVAQIWCGMFMPFFSKTTIMNFAAKEKENCLESKRKWSMRIKPTRHDGEDKGQRLSRKNYLISFFLPCYSHEIVTNQESWLVPVAATMIMIWGVSKPLLWSSYTVLMFSFDDLLQDNKENQLVSMILIYPSC